MKLQVPAGYQIQRLLGQGGMGKVYLAQRAEGLPPVALKILSVDPGVASEALRRFRREAEIQARIEHPNVVGIYEFSFDHQPPYLALEYVEGQDLESLLEWKGALPVDQAMRLAADLANALDCLHDQGLLHRDIKPSNIMIRRRDGSAVLMDLGLARVEHGTVVTATGQLVGTPLYLPPELVSEGGWTPRGDQYQLGAVLFEILTGQTLLEGETLTDLFHNLMAGRQRPFPEDSPVPEGVREAVYRAVAQDPEERFESCRELIAALSGRSQPRAPAGRRQLSGRMPALGAEPPREASGSFPSWRRPALLGALSLVGLALGMGFSLGSGGSKPEQVTWKVIGDVVQVRFRPGAVRDLRLEVGDRIVREMTQEGEEGRFEFRGLPPHQAISGRLLWQGGEGLEVSLEAGVSAIAEDFRLLPGRRLGLRLRRPVRVHLEGEPTPTAAQPPGDFELELPPGDRSLPPLVWEEEGVEFRRPWDWSEVHAASLRLLQAAPQSEDQPELVEAMATPERRATALDPARELWRPVAAWLPELLTGGLPRPDRIRLWNQAQVMERLQHFESTFSENPGSLALFPGSGMGTRGAELPLPVELGIRLIPELQGEELILVGGQERDWIRASAVAAVDGHVFPWPRIPGNTGLLLLAAEVRKLRREFVLAVSPEKGEGLSLELWHPLVKQTDSRHIGWTFLRFPRELAPAPGTPMLLRVIPRRPQEVENCRVVDLRVFALPAGL